MRFRFAKSKIFVGLTLLFVSIFGMEVNAQTSSSECSIELLNEEKPNEISFDVTPHRIFEV